MQQLRQTERHIEFTINQKRLEAQAEIQDFRMVAVAAGRAFCSMPSTVALSLFRDSQKLACSSDSLAVLCSITLSATTFQT